jgi:hypothetical protein
MEPVAVRRIAGKIRVYHMFADEWRTACGLGVMDRQREAPEWRGFASYCGSCFRVPTNVVAMRRAHTDVRHVRG